MMEENKKEIARCPFNGIPCMAGDNCPSSCPERCWVLRSLLLSSKGQHQQVVEAVV